MSIPFNFEHIHCGDILHKTIISLHKNPFNAHSTTYTVRYIEYIKKEKKNLEKGHIYEN